MYRKFLTWAKGALDWLTEPLHLISLALSMIPLMLLIIFIRIHQENIVWSDEVLRGLDLILSHLDGHTDWRYVFMNNGGHYNVPTYLLMLLLASVTDYNVEIGMWINMLSAVLVCIMLVRVFHRVLPQATPYAMPFISMFVFSLTQDINWLGLYFGHFLIASFFFVASLWLLVDFPARIWAQLWSLIASAAAAFAATFSSGHGLIVWFLLAPVLWFTGRRRWWHYAIWVAFAGVALALYFGGSRQGSSLIKNLATQNLLIVLKFGLVFLGGVLTGRVIPEDFGFTIVHTLAVIVAVFGFVLALINGIVLWRHEMGRKTLQHWLPVLAFGALPGFMIGLMRFNPEMGMINRPLFGWYGTMIMPFWIGVTGLVIASLWLITRTSLTWKDWRQWLVVLNIGGLSAVLLLHIIQSSRVEQTSIVGPNPYLQLLGTPLTERCATEYIFTLDRTCVGEWHPSTDQVATYKLNLFADLEPINIMPPEYGSGERLIVEIPAPWGAVHMRNWSLVGVAEQDMFFVFPEDEKEEAEIETIPHPVTQKIAGASEAELADLREFISGEAVIWYVRKMGTPLLLEDFFEGLSDQGYEADGEFLDARGIFMITRYVNRGSGD